MRSVQDVEKLVGFSRDDRDELLIIVSGVPQFLSLATGQQVSVPFDKNLADDLTMLNHLRDWARDYGDTRVYIGTERKPALGGEVEWTDVYWKGNSGHPVNVSGCDGVRCGQPSLSADGKQIAYIRARQD
jgi:hypothetical protein